MKAEQASASHPTRRVAILLIVSSLIAGAVGVGAGWLIRSPAQLAAEAAPPAQSVLTAEVAEGVLDKDVKIPGVVAVGDLREFTPSAPADKSAIVTKVPVSVGDAVAAGGVLIEVSDRPVLYLQGSVPLLRDLGPGDRGDDVARLQSALMPWGLPTSDGKFGPGTTRALQKLYQAAGYRAPADGSALQSELVFGPGATARIVSFGSGLGTPVASPLVTVTTSPPIVTAEISAASAQQFSVGQPARVDGTGIGGSFDGVLKEISPAAKTDDGAYRSRISIEVNTELPGEAVNSPVDVVIPSTEQGEPGLIIPVSGIYSDASGARYVLRSANGQQKRIAVVVTESSNGQARITTADTTLAAGDSVVVGSR